MLFRLRQIHAFNILIDDEDLDADIIELLEKTKGTIEDLDKDRRKLKQRTAEEQRQLAIDTRVLLFNSQPESKERGMINLACGGLPNDDQDEATIPDSAFKALLRKSFKLGCVGDNVVRPNKFNFLVCDCPDLMMERIQVYMSSGNCQACQLWYYDAKDNMRNFDNLTLDSRGDLLNLPMSMLPKQKKKDQNNPQDTSSAAEEAEKKLLKWLGQNENTKLDDIPKEARMKMMERFLKEQKNVSKILGDPKGSKKHSRALFVTEKIMELEKATSKSEQEELKRHFPVDNLDELMKLDVYTAEERQNLMKLSEECKVLQNQKAARLSLSDKLSSEGITAEAAESTQFVVETLSKISSQCDIAKIEEIKKHFPFLNYWIEMNHLVIDTSRIPEDKMDELCEYLVNESMNEGPDTAPVDQNTCTLEYKCEKKRVVFTQEDFLPGNESSRK